MSKTISNQDLEQAAQEIAKDVEYGKNEELLKMVFGKFPNNKNFIEVLLKVKLIDTLYSTQLSKQRKKVSTKKIVETIVELDFDKKIKNGDLSVVDDFLKSIDVNLFSFISKYCTIHSYFVYGKDDFAIFDNVVAEHICEYTDEPNVKKSIGNEYRKHKDYRGWVSLINEILQKNHITTLHAKRKLDWLIWYSNRGV